MRKADLVLLLSQSDARWAVRERGILAAGRSGEQAAPGAMSADDVDDDDEDAEAVEPQKKRARRTGAGAAAKKAEAKRAVEVDADVALLGEWQDELESSIRAPVTGDKVLDTLRRELRYEGFRGKQEWVVRRILAGQSTMMVAPTGSGKSLTYQLPALLLRRGFILDSDASAGTGARIKSGITVVVSPLVSLMED